MNSFTVLRKGIKKKETLKILTYRKCIEKKSDKGIQLINYFEVIFLNIPVHHGPYETDKK